VKVRFVRSGNDAYGASNEVRSYEVYRRDAPTPAASMASGDPAGPTASALLDDG